MNANAKIAMTFVFVSDQHVSNRTNLIYQKNCPGKKKMRACLLFVVASTSAYDTHNKTRCILYMPTCTPYGTKSIAGKKNRDATGILAIPISDVATYLFGM